MFMKHQLWSTANQGL